MMQRHLLFVYRNRTHSVKKKTENRGVVVQNRAGDACCAFLFFNQFYYLKSDF